MLNSLERDFIGYGEHPPQAEWPNGAKLALNFVLNYEEGSEYALDLGDGLSDAGLTEAPSSVPQGARDLAAESMFEYGSRVGFWRLHRLFQSRGLPMTIYACALALERNPDAARAIAAADYDICCHGWRWVEHYKLSEAEERAHIARAVTSLQKTVGKAPDGWYCRYGPSVNTRRLVTEHGGFLYDSDSYADELPFYVEQDGAPRLVVPYTLTNNDLKWSTGNLSDGESFYRSLKESFDMLLEEGATTPKMMNVGLHMRLVGHPGRASGLARFLDYARSKPEVWICKRVDIARHWLQRHPPEAAA
ncbi:chitin deacetylase (plasmid) [Salipiger sp. CCB-MM3]|uniref:allantoinase PuuE n=1 Tax=Salipiger sp. CCB-MM3 TaxID=1792508 RepID=UPI00080AA6EB|nr:allantoinase PuuE [Salipiger sp. CCB-MM3]ANT63671.1 chitin deacetylase [Salipiger sp. CCB-MM3]